MVDEGTIIEDGALYEDRTLVGLDLRGRRLAGVEFAGCRFERCTFNEAEIYRCTLRECRFNGCDLSVVKLTNSRFADTAFKGCKLLGVDWTLAGDTGATKLPLGVAFEDCVLNLCSFIGLPLKGVRLLRCSAHEADFSEADLSNAECRESDFTSARFVGTNLTGADFTGARNYRIDPRSTKLRGARFSLPEALALLEPFGIELS